MFLHPAVHAIVSETRNSCWNFPSFVRERKRLRRNAYMRDYMRIYRKRSSYLNMPLSKEQRHRLAEEAKAVGRTPTACFREAAFVYFDRRIFLPTSYEQTIANRTADIRRVGNNINQIAYHVNTRQRTKLRELQQVTRLLESLEAGTTRLSFFPLPPAPILSPGLTHEIAAQRIRV